MPYYDHYLPERLSLLFIAEAAPRLEKHFYKANTPLYRAIKASFQAVFGPFESEDDFLTFFKESGCYLDHLCLHPIDTSTPERRQHARSECRNQLAQRLSTYQPQLIIVVMKSLEKDIRLALQASSLAKCIPLRITAFPSMSEQNRQACQEAIVAALKEALDQKWL